MSEAFLENKADFSGMTENPMVYLSQIAHEAWVQVNEEGTEAAAATAVYHEVECEGLCTITVDHPFLFIISDKRAKGSILFLGQLINPLEQILNVEC